MTTKSVPVQSGQSTRAWIHTILLEDQTSCEIPKGRGTITLEEWKVQQAARPRAGAS